MLVLEIWLLIILITEKPDSYVIFGGHMNVGENKKSKLYGEILSTYWMERISQNMIINDFRTKRFYA